MEKWTKLEDESPMYYAPVNIKLKSGETMLAWRATDGENETYTNNDCCVYTCDDVDSWEKTVDSKFIVLSKHNLRDDVVQKFLNENDLPLFQEMKKRGTHLMDRVAYIMLFHNKIIGYMVTTEGFIPYEEDGVLKYDAIHVNDIELLEKYKGMGLGRETLKAFERHIDSNKYSRITLVGKNDYLTLYYKFIGFTEAKNGILYRKLNK